MAREQSGKLSPRHGIYRHRFEVPSGPIRWAHPQPKQAGAVFIPMWEATQGLTTHMFDDSMHEELREVATREDVFSVWDRKAVIIREQSGFVFVYPALGRGVRYRDFDLRHECCLDSFVDISKAKLWAFTKGLSYVVLV